MSGRRDSPTSLVNATSRYRTSSFRSSWRARADCGVAGEADITSMVAGLRSEVETLRKQNLASLESLANRVDVDGQATTQALANIQQAVQELLPLGSPNKIGPSALGRRGVSRVLAAEEL